IDSLNDIEQLHAHHRRLNDRLGNLDQADFAVIEAYAAANVQDRLDVTHHLFGAPSRRPDDMDLLDLLLRIHDDAHRQDSADLGDQLLDHGFVDGLLFGDHTCSFVVE